jgi:hypothetical protein
MNPIRPPIRRADLRRRVAGEPLDVCADPRGREGPVLHREGIQDGRTRGHDVLEAPLRLPKGLLRLLPLRDVGHECTEEVRAFLLQRGHGEFDGELGAVPSHRAQLGPTPDDRPFAGFEESRQAARVCLAVARWDDQVGENTADRLVAGPAEEGLRADVPGRDAALLVHHDDGVEGGVEHGRHSRLAL